MLRCACVTSAVWLIVAGLMVAIWCDGATAQARRANQADALTVHEFREAGRRMWQPIVVAPYREAARDDEAAIDDATVELLEAIALRLTDARAAQDWAAIEQTAADLLDEQPRNPHVRGWYAHALTMRGQMKEAEPHARAAADALLDDEATPLMLRALTAARMARIYHGIGEAERGDTFDQRAIRLYVQALVDAWPNQGLQQREMVRWVRVDTFDELSHDQQKAFYERCDEQGVATWTTKLLGGIAHLRLGRQITREYGHGPHPLERGAAYQRHMTDAKRFLVEAHQLHPDRPEAATWLIALADQGYAPTGTTHRHWFSMATAAQFDHIPAYTRMIEALRPHPHRGGSRDELLEFGVSCLDTERFDTDVPYQFLRAVERYAELLGGDYAGAFATDDVAERMLWMLHAYRAQPGRSNERAWLDSLIAAVAWRSGRNEAAAEALQSAGEQLDGEAFERVGAMPDRAVGEILARTGELARATRDVEQLVDRGRHEVAIAELEELALRHGDDAPLRQFFTHMAGQIRITRDLQRGGEATLTPGAELAGWSPMVGAWSVEEDGTLVGRSSDKGLWIACDVPLGTSFEMTAEVELDAEVSEGQPNGGMFFGHRSGKGFHTFFAFHDNGSAQLNRGLWGGTEADAPVRLVNRLRLVVRNRRIYAYVNGRPVFHNAAPRQLPEDETARIGLGGHYASEGAEVRFRNIRARRIEARSVSERPRDGRPVLAGDTAALTRGLLSVDR